MVPCKVRLSKNAAHRRARGSQLRRGFDSHVDAIGVDSFGTIIGLPRGETAGGHGQVPEMRAEVRKFEARPAL